MIYLILITGLNNLKYIYRNQLYFYAQNAHFCLSLDFSPSTPQPQWSYATVHELRY